MLRRDAVKRIIPAMALPLVALKGMDPRQAPQIELAEAGMPGAENINKVFLDGKLIKNCTAFSQTEGWVTVWEDGVTIRHYGVVTYTTL